MSAPVVVKYSSSSRLRRLSPRAFRGALALVPETLGDGDSNATGASRVVGVEDKVDGWVLNDDEPAYLSCVAGLTLHQEAFTGWVCGNESMLTVL